MSRTRRKNTTELGREGENLAAGYLEEKGYVILERNWYDNHRELDMVAKKDNKIVFVEVKTRMAGSPELPFEVIDRKKHRLLTEAANAYIEKKKIEREARFDVIFVIFHSDHTEINHVEEAIFPEIRP